MRTSIRLCLLALFLTSVSAFLLPPVTRIRPAQRVGPLPKGSASCDFWRRPNLALLRKTVDTLAPVRVPPLSCAKQEREGDSVEASTTPVKQWPIVRSLVAFGKWLVASFRSLLVMRFAWIMHATARIKAGLLDPKRPLDDGPGTRVDARPSANEVAASVEGGAGAQAFTNAQEVTPEDLKQKMNEIERLTEKQRQETSVEVACQSFWDSLEQATSPSVEATLAKLKEESAQVQQKHALELQNAAGVHLSVLDFVLDGGMPPSVEALTAWLEYRGIDTLEWGRGQAKTVQDFFHEIWAGECEPLSGEAQRQISVVKVRILDEDDKGTWQLYETKQKFCRDGRTRPRNKPLAEKKRPRETPMETAVRGVMEELGSELEEDCEIEVNEESLEEWVECRHSNSFPGLETVYKLYQVDVKVEGLTRARTGESFESLETPNLSTGKVHSWTWKPSGGVDWQPVDVLKAKAADPPASATAATKESASEGNAGAGGGEGPPASKTEP